MYTQAIVNTPRTIQIPHQHPATLISICVAILKASSFQFGEKLGDDSSEWLDVFSDHVNQGLTAPAKVSYCKIVTLKYTEYEQRNQ